jgi:hypothetical protein
VLRAREKEKERGRENEKKINSSPVENFQKLYEIE